MFFSKSSKIQGKSEFFDPIPTYLAFGYSWWGTKIVKNNILTLSIIYIIVYIYLQKQTIFDTFIFTPNWHLWTFQKNAKSNCYFLFVQLWLKKILHEKDYLTVDTTYHFCLWLCLHIYWTRKEGVPPHSWTMTSEKSSGTGISHVYIIYMACR